MDAVQFYRPPLGTPIYANHRREHRSAAAVYFCPFYSKRTSKIANVLLPTATSNHATITSNFSRGSSRPLFIYMLQQSLPSPSTGPRISKSLLQERASATVAHVNHTTVGLEGCPSGSRDQPMIIEEEAGTTDADTEDETISCANIEAGRPDPLLETGSAQDPVSGPCVSVNPSTPNSCGGVGDGGCVDKRNFLPSLAKS